MAAAYPTGIATLGTNTDGLTTVDATYMDKRDDEVLAVERSLGIGLVSSTALVSPEFSLAHHVKVEDEDTLRLGGNKTGVLIGDVVTTNWDRTLVADRTFSSTGAARTAMFQGDITVTPSSSSSIYGVGVAPRKITMSTANTHAVVASLGVFRPNLIVTSGSIVSTASSLYVANAPSQGSKKYALFVDSGISRFDGNGNVVFELPEDDTNLTGNITGRIPVRIEGQLRYIPYYTG